MEREGERSNPSLVINLRHCNSDMTKFGKSQFMGRERMRESVGGGGGEKENKRGRERD